MKKERLSLQKLNITSFTTMKTQSLRGGTFEQDDTNQDACSFDTETNQTYTYDRTACYGDKFCQVYIYDSVQVC